MKAAVCRSFGAPLAIEELTLEAPGEGEVLVDLVACAICHSDVALAEGAWGGELPAVYGHEAAGVVREIGPAVTGVRPGVPVAVGLIRSCGKCFFCARGDWHLCEGEFAGDGRPRLRAASGEPVHQAMHVGAFAEAVVVHESQVAVVPASISLEAASLLGCGVITGVGSVLDKAAVGPASSVVVIGTGGVGVNVVQGARLAGAGPIVAVDPAAAKRRAATTLGATHALDPAADDVATDVRAVTGGRGADYVFVTVARAEVVKDALRYARRGGTVVLVGMPPADETFRVVAVDLVHDDVRILGHKIGSASGRFADAIPRLVQLYEDGRLQVDELVTGRYPLERIGAAIQSANAGDAIRNVIVFGRG